MTAVRAPPAARTAMAHDPRVEEITAIPGASAMIGREAIGERRNPSLATGVPRPIGTAPNHTMRRCGRNARP